MLFRSPMSPADQSVGKQLPYVPEFSATVTGRLSWRTWSLLYKWCYYSQRYPMSSNDYTLTGYLPPYFMNNVTLEKQLSLIHIYILSKQIISESSVGVHWRI